MIGPTVREVYEARRRLEGRARRTPLERAAWLSEIAGCDVYLKLECWQRTGSFKLRGATNAVLALGPELRGREVVTASAGNHGMAVALAAKEAGARAVVWVPETSPETKKARIRALGAELRTTPGTYDDAHAAAHAYAGKTGGYFLHAFDDPRVVAGQGTVALEIVEELPGVREVLVPVGGGGLIAGVGLALRAVGGREVAVLGVQSENTSTMYHSFRAGRVVEPVAGPTLADGLAGGIEEGSFQRARAVTDELSLVTEASIPRAIRVLYERMGIVAEGSGAVGVAAILEGRVRLRGPAVVVISGGNIDGHRLAEVLTSG